MSRDIERLILPNAIVPIDAKTTGALVHEVMRLRKGIHDYLDGNYEGPHKARTRGPQEKCQHGHPYWEACDTCIDEYFEGLLNVQKS